MTFDAYARYYDLIYADKDYAAEARYLDTLLARHGRPIETVLELGCGTGRHARHLAETGRRVHGIDRSAEMVARATQRAHAHTSFSEGDVRTVRVGRTFDAAVSLFHVISYQTTDDDLDAALATAAAHLSSGGLFVFDFWYGPAVLADRPSIRIKRVEDDAVAVTRLAEPVLHPERDVVDVHFDVFVREKATGAITQLRETHPMRYFFQPHLRDRLAAHGFAHVELRAWQRDEEPSPASWYAVALARRA